MTMGRGKKDSGSETDQCLDCTNCAVDGSPHCSNCQEHLQWADEANDRERDEEMETD